MVRFVDCEKWRKDFGVDELVRTFDYKEKPKVFEYYPQYYHKTDKVITTRPSQWEYRTDTLEGGATSLHRAIGQNRPCRHVQDHLR